MEGFQCPHARLFLLYRITPLRRASGGQRNDQRQQGRKMKVAGVPASGLNSRASAEISAKTKAGASSILAGPVSARQCKYYRRKSSRAVTSLDG
ncbi:hypothetical protein MRX96_025432 [Rhipicephalus microplus]